MGAEGRGLPACRGGGELAQAASSDTTHARTRRGATDATTDLARMERIGRVVMARVARDGDSL